MMPPGQNRPGGTTSPLPGISFSETTDHGEPDLAALFHEKSNLTRSRLYIKQGRLEAYAHQQVTQSLAISLHASPRAETDGLGHFYMTFDRFHSFCLFRSHAGSRSHDSFRCHPSVTYHAPATISEESRGARLRRRLTDLTHNVSSLFALLPRDSAFRSYGRLGYLAVMVVASESASEYVVPSQIFFSGQNTPGTKTRLPCFIFTSRACYAPCVRMNFLARASMRDHICAHPSSAMAMRASTMARHISSIPSRPSSEV